jgi:hypothetical protein
MALQGGGGGPLGVKPYSGDPSVTMSCLHKNMQTDDRSKGGGGGTQSKQLDGAMVAWRNLENRTHHRKECVDPHEGRHPLLSQSA